ncbi:MAG: winged helix-turn-helix domain-containing protein [Actinobacteria bacterium]|nr:winged helix-turn-helix domain-containing protein [Actinomycetota bacterium]MCG2801335.1 winged helix-turn-helix domain-containing protein [Cellulomonas sp.]
MPLALASSPAPARHAQRLGAARTAARPPTPRPAGPSRGFVLSVDLSAVEDQDPAEVLRVVATLAELAGEWFPQARARAVVSSPGQPTRSLPSDRTSTFRDRLDRLAPEADVVVDPLRRTVTASGRHIELTAQETALLVHLARAEGRTVPRAELLEAVWHGHELSAGTRTIDVHVRRLRAKTGLADLVATVWGVGYRIDPSYAVRVQS